MTSRRPRRSSSDAPPNAGASGNGTATGESAAGDPAARLWWTLAGVLLISWGFMIEVSAREFTWVAIVALLSTAWGILTLVLTWVSREWRLARGWSGELFAWATVAVSIAGLAVWALLEIHGAPAYATDEVAFNQYAATLAQHGLNPFTHSMAPAFSQYRVSAGGYTYTLTGARVTQFSYPALSFLVYVPFLALGWTNQMAPMLDVAAWAVVMIMLFAMLPRRHRALALALGSAAVYTNLAVFGLTDMMFMPLLLLAAYRWSGFDARSWRSYVGPVALGLAMAMKQTPWPILPFVVLGLLFEEQARSDLRAALRYAGAYLAAVLAAFLVPNLPYLIDAPSAWVHGVLTPFVHDLVPAGQGFIGLTLFLRIGGGSLTAYSLLALFVLVLLIVVYCASYPRLRPTAFLLPAIAYFFNERSYAIYLVALIPAGIIAALSTLEVRGLTLRGTADVPPVRPSSGTPPRWAAWARSPLWALATWVTALLCVVFAVLALSAPAPLSLRVTDAVTAGSNNLVENLTVRVHNNSESPVTPAFTLETGSGVTSFFYSSGPHVLQPHASATYTLGSPNLPSELSINQGLTVVALLTNPGSVSVSSTYSPPTWHGGFSPESIDQLVPIGRAIPVSVQLMDSLNQPIHRAGVPVTVTQSITGGVRAATLNGGRPGDRATAVTNGSGVAHFRIVGVGVSAFPVTFSIGLPSGKPLGYLAVGGANLIVRFRPAS